MMPLPEKFELISFFEADPIVAFPNETWEYNHLTFTVIRGEERLVCEMEPAELVFHLRWYRQEVEMVNIHLASADGLKVFRTDESEQMRVTFSDGIGQIIVQLKPTIHVFVETKLL